MARGTDFGGVHSSTDLHLIQQKVVVQPAEPKLNMIEVPGADGSKDLSEQPSGRVVSQDREIEWTFALYPGENWDEKHSQVSGALNGRRCRITLDTDPEYYYLGRLVVSKHKVDGLLRQITVEATCHPYKLKQQTTTLGPASLTTTPRVLTLTNGRKPAVPTITVTADTTIVWNGRSYSVAAGTHKILDFELREGLNTFHASVTSGTGSITVVYQEGAL